MQTYFKRKALDDALENDDAAALHAECLRLRQYLWDCYAAAGSDTDGNLNPDAVVSNLGEMAVRAVQELHTDYFEAIGHNR